METVKPLFSRPIRYEDQGQTRRSTSGERLKQRSVPSRIKLLVAEIGLRFRPTERTDLEAHSARIALLTTDLADMPVSDLERAIAVWVAKSRFMPTAAELVEIARGFIAGERQERRQESGDDHVLAEMNARRSNLKLMWFRDAGGSLRLFDRQQVEDAERRASVS
ncbi:MAG: hypothetical protein JWR10_959 [Rubritepida sp.]|nr:hypothetical protein [Rubritepida sp.]